MSTFSLQSAQEAAENDGLKPWAISFLNGEGNNAKLAGIIQDTHCNRIEMLEYPLHSLTRIAGPEEGMVFFEHESIWEPRIQSLQEILAKGFKPPPLIVTDFWGDLHISDGAHRHEALLRSGFENYWCIFFEK